MNFKPSKSFAAICSFASLGYAFSLNLLLGMFIFLVCLQNWFKNPISTIDGGILIQGPLPLIWFPSKILIKFLTIKSIKVNTCENIELSYLNKNNIELKQMVIADRQSIQKFLEQMALNPEIQILNPENIKIGIEKFVIKWVSIVISFVIFIYFLRYIIPVVLPGLK